MENLDDLPDLRLVVGGSTDLPSIAHPCVNPDHTDAHPSMQVYSDHLHCFACGYHAAGDDALLALTGAADIATAHTATRTLPRAVTGGQVKRPSWRTLREQPLRAALATLFHEQLVGPMAHRLVWLTDRGLSRTTIEEARLGYHLNRFVLPIWDRDGTTLLTLRYRLDPDRASALALQRSKYLGVAGRNMPLLYGAWWLAKHWPDTLVLCEGELDALRLQQEGVVAIALTNGAGQLGKTVGLLREMFPRRRLARLLVASDMDKAGDQAAADVAREAAQLMPITTVERVRWERALYGKDVTEYLQAGGDVRLFAGKEVDACGRAAA